MYFYCNEMKKCTQTKQKLWRTIIHLRGEGVGNNLQNQISNRLMGQGGGGGVLMKISSN